jgi:hypothetical protein
MVSFRRVVLWCAVVHGVLQRSALLTRIGAKISGAEKRPRLTLTDLEEDCDVHTKRTKRG